MIDDLIRLFWVAPGKMLAATWHATFGNEQRAQELIRDAQRKAGLL